jgi:hypothetical protein
MNILSHFTNNIGARVGILHLPAQLHWSLLFWYTGVWIQGFMLGRQVLTAWATPLTPFPLVILEIGSCLLPRLAWTTVASCCHWDDRYTPWHPAFSCWDRSVMNFLVQTEMEPLIQH